MSDILQGLQMQNEIPDFLKKDTGGIQKHHKNKEKHQIKLNYVLTIILKEKKKI